MPIKESGVGSLTWYLKAIKVNPENSGINFLTKYRGIGWYDADEAVKTLIGRGMVLAKGKPESKRKHYELTSFGHRYLEEHKSDLEGLEVILPAGQQKPIELPSSRVSEEKSSTAAPGLGIKHTIPELPGLVRSLPASPENDRPTVEMLPGTNRPLDQSHKFNDMDDDTPTVARDTNVPTKTPDSFVDQLKKIAGDLALEKFADQITVKDLIDHAEKWS